MPDIHLDGLGPARVEVARPVWVLGNVQPVVQVAHPECVVKLRVKPEVVVPNLDLAADFMVVLRFCAGGRVVESEEEGVGVRG